MRKALKPICTDLFGTTFSLLGGLELLEPELDGNDPDQRLQATTTSKGQAHSQEGGGDMESDDRHWTILD
jgi:hypothetical protein